MRRIARIAATLTIALALSSCGRQPTGQVAAVIGDEDVTLQEINAELSDSKLPAGADAKAVQQGALQRIVDRRMLASIARDQDIDKKPEFQIRKRQLEDALLIQLLGEQSGRSLRVPDAAALDKFIAANPSNFARREVLVLDQVRFAMPADPTKLRALEKDHSIDAVAATLRDLGIPFERGVTELDTAVVSRDVVSQINGLPPGEPFIIPENNIVSASAITGRKSAPLGSAQARPIAVQMMRSEALRKLLDQRLKAKRAEMKVVYQPGFAPATANRPTAVVPVSKAR